MLLTRRFALIAPISLVACAPSAPPVGLPFFEANDHIVAPVAFEGRQTLALLDNGAPLTSLDQAFAEQAGLKKSAVGAGLDPLPMTLGETQIRVHPFLEDMTEAAIAADAPVRVIAGMELFQAFVVALAFSRGELSLYVRPHFKPKSDHLSLRLDQGPLPHPGVEIAINDAPPMSAYLDLGCSSALLVSPSLAQRLGLGKARAISTRQVILSGPEGLGLGVSRLTSIDRLTFAGQSFADVPIDILPDDARPFAGIDAVIGQPLLRKFDLALDLPRWLHLRPNARLARPFDRRMTGLQTKPEGAALLVRHVALRSPAEAAGFSTGDRITAIDGRPPLMRTLRTAAAGQSLDITLAGGGRRRLTAKRFY